MSIDYQTDLTDSFGIKCDLGMIMTGVFELATLIKISEVIHAAIDKSTLKKNRCSE